MDHYYYIIDNKVNVLQFLTNLSVTDTSTQKHTVLEFEIHFKMTDHPCLPKCWPHLMQVAPELPTGSGPTKGGCLPRKFPPRRGEARNTASHLSCPSLCFQEAPHLPWFLPGGAFPVPLSTFTWSLPK